MVSSKLFDKGPTGIVHDGYILLSIALLTFYIDFKIFIKKQYPIIVFMTNYGFVFIILLLVFLPRLLVKQLEWY
jgi:hypothetical protein